MNKGIITSEISVNNNKINVMRIGNKDVIAYLGLWEKLNNENFKGIEFDTVENDKSIKELEALNKNLISTK